MKSRNTLKLLFVILASASVAKTSSAILPAALIPASVAGKCLAGSISSAVALRATELLYRATYKKLWHEKNQYGDKGSIWNQYETFEFFFPKYYGYYCDKDGKRHSIPKLPIIAQTNVVVDAVLTCATASCHFIWSVIKEGFKS